MRLDQKIPRTASEFKEAVGQEHFKIKFIKLNGEVRESYGVFNLEDVPESHRPIGTGSPSTKEDHIRYFEPGNMRWTSAILENVFDFKVIKKEDRQYSKKKVDPVPATPPNDTPETDTPELAHCDDSINVGHIPPSLQGSLSSMRSPAISSSGHAMDDVPGKPDLSQYNT